MNGNGQVVPASSRASQLGRGRGIVTPRVSRCLRRVAAAGSGLVLLSVMALSPVVAAPASAAGATWYAYAGGGATGTPSTCPQTTTTSDQCTLMEALSAAAAGDIVFLATPGGSGTGEADYVGNWTVSTSGTSSSAPLTIEPASGVADPTLDGNGGSNSSPCSTLGCDGPVLTISNQAFVDIDGVTFQNANDTLGAGDGGGIQNDAGGTLTLTGATFSGNTAVDGGAIANGDTGSGTLNVSGSTFSGNTATADGGAIVSGERAGSTGTVVVTSSTFSGNTSTSDDGGAIDSGDYQGTGTLSVTGSTFSDNVTVFDGGAIDSGDDAGNGTLTVADDTFSGNTGTKADGGAIDSGDDSGNATLSVDNTTFSANTADWGGAIDSGDDSGNGTVTISGSTFTGNSVKSDGGAVNNGDFGGTGSLTVSASTFSGNTSSGGSGTDGGDGGAIDNGDNGPGNHASTVAVTTSTFSDNTANHDGGAVDNGDFAGLGTLSVTGSTFSGNNASTVNGGAIDNGDNHGNGAATVGDSTFFGNSASDFGGAIDNGSGSTGALTATASTFSGNTAPLGGGTIASGEFNGAANVLAAADIFNGSCVEGAGTWDDEGYSVGSDASCFSATPASTDNDSAAAALGSLLGPLANNGGPTETALPLPGNPALSIVPNATSVNLDDTSATLCPTTDQRGVASEPGQACDAGSVQEGVPVALAQSFSTTEGTELTEPAGTLQSGVVDFNPGVSSWTAELTATATAGTATVGTVVVFPDGSFTYTPEAGFLGTDNFSYTLTDNLGYTSAPATGTLVVSTAPPNTTTTLTSTTTTLPGTAAPPVVATSTTTTTTTAPTPPKPFPHSNQSYPNGAIVSFAGRDYVFAGGRAFPGSASQLTALEKVDPAKVTSAPAGTSAPTSAAPRSGTLLTTRAVNGNATIYFAGTDGELHGFSTGHQLSSDGYDPALVVTVPSLGSLRVGSAAGAEGSAASALATRADGAIVDSSGTFYVLAGGRAFGISSPAGLRVLQKGDKAQVLTGPVGAAQKSAAIASGTLLSAPGKVYVAYSGALYLFKTTAQLDRDGYGGTDAVPVPGTGGLGVVSSYSGS